MPKNEAKANKVNQTGLYWPGKRTEVERVILPFQVVETINESKADREKAQRDLFTKQARDELWRNKLIWGDNKYIMASLLPEFAGKINLIYIDPPFATGADFSINIKLGDLKWTKEASVIEEKAYRDTWGRGLDSYLQMIYDRLVLMRELLADNGTIWVHLDDHVGHYAKILLDEIFGKEQFINEIIWYYPDNFQGNVNRYADNHNLVLVFGKTQGVRLQRVKIALDKPIKRDKRIWDKELGKVVAARDEKGKIIYETFTQKFADNVWTIGQSSVSKERSMEFLGYPTQKPEELLRRVVLSASNEGDLVADFFCGSGTTLAVAEKLGRRWIGSDLSKFAIHTTRKRLLDIKECQPFEVLNLGKYQKAKLKENGVSRYINFILKLYRAESLSGYTTLHGKKAGRMVHIGDVDSIVTEREIRETVKECASAGVKSVDILGWDFEMGLHDLVDRIGDEHSVRIRLVQIPREALEIRDAAREEVKFFDLNYLELEHKLSGKTLTIALKEFVISNPEYLPGEVKEKVRKFTDYIDYWAVDFDYRNDTFHNMWQSFRTRKHPNLEPKCSHTYLPVRGTQTGEKVERYQVLVKVVDIFGNDTNKLLEIEL